MTFTEKSSWVMAILLSGLGILYAQSVLEISQTLGETAPPNIGYIAFLTIILIGAAIITHIIIAVLDLEGADAADDERDTQISRRSGSIAGYVLGLGVFGGLWHYYTHSDGNMLFHILVVSMIISQVSQDILSIIFYRRGV